MFVLSDGLMIFLAMVFVAVFMLSQGLIVPVFGESSKMRKRLKQRLNEIESATDDEAISSLLRKKYLRRLTLTERNLESLPGMPAVGRLIEQAGHTMPAYRLTLISLVLCWGGAAICWSFSRSVPFTIVAGLAGFLLPFFKIYSDRKARIEKFEEQLPDAIDSMKRALRAGHPFSAALKLVAEDMDDPVGGEFELTFADINYGNDVRRAMLGLLQRMPSLTVMALVTSVLVQKETGGNLAEILDQISKVIRGRFRFHRRVRTLSAEGRLSAWILALMPLILFAVVSVTTPTYLPVLLDNPVGRKLIIAGCIMGVIGLYWIRRIVRIDV